MREYEDFDLEGKHVLITVRSYCMDNKILDLVYSGKVIEETDDWLKFESRWVAKEIITMIEIEEENKDA